MVRTGSHVYVKYGFEVIYADGATGGTGGVPNKKFGLQDKLSSLSLTNNRVNLNSLNQNTVHTFAYGQQQGSASVSFILSNPWIFGALLGAPTTAVSGSAYTHTYTFNGTTDTNRNIRTIAVELGYDGADADIVRTLKGGIINTLSVSAAVGGMVECSTDITYGVESAPSTTLGTAPALPTVNTPYTFAHAELLVNGSVVAECQDVSLSINQNAELLYKLNSHSATNAYRKLTDITGSFRASWINKALLEKVLEQVKLGTSSDFSELVGGSPTFRLTFEKSATEKIVITGGGLSIGEQSISGLEPNEPIFEEINWQMKTLTLVATSTISGEE